MIRWRTIATVIALVAVGGALAWGHRQRSERDRIAGMYGPSSAIAGLRAHLGAQGTFRRKDRYGVRRLVYANPRDGTGFQDLYRIGGPDGSGETLKYIDGAFARATTARAAKTGYWFVDIVADHDTGPYDYSGECGLCAVPAVHGETGIHTFIINAEGTVYKKDNGGRPVTVWPDVVKDGWRAVGL